CPWESAADVDKLLPEILRLGQAWLYLAVGCVLLTLVLGGYWLTTKSRLLPPQRSPAVPWRGLEILGLFYLAYLVWPMFCNELLKALGFYSWMYGPDFLPANLAEASEEVRQRVTDRQVLWQEFFSFPLRVATVLMLFHALSETRPYQLGLSGS